MSEESCTCRLSVRCTHAYWEDTYKGCCIVRVRSCARLLRTAQEEEKEREEQQQLRVSYYLSLVHSYPQD